MNNIRLILLTLCLALCSAAVSAVEPAATDTFYYSTDNGEGRDIYAYDARGAVLWVESSEEQLDGSWRPELRTTYDYDAAGNKLEALDSEYRNSRWEDVHRVRGTYDSRNCRIREVEQVKENGRWVGKEMLTSVYDENRVLTERIFYVFEDGQWVNDEKQCYRSEGLRTFYTGYQWNGTAWIMLEKSDVTYDDEDRIREEIDYENEDGQWVPVTRRVIDYRPGKMPLWTYETRALYRMEDGQWVGQSKTEIYFCESCDDAIGICSGSWHWENGEWKAN